MTDKSGILLLSILTVFSIFDFFKGDDVVGPVFDASLVVFVAGFFSGLCGGGQQKGQTYSSILFAS